MPDYILIIHPSGIVRMGLREACRDLQDVSIHIMEDVDISLNTITLRQNLQILMIDATSTLAAEIISQKDKKRSFRTIGISYPEQQSINNGNFDAEINVNMTIDKIQDCILHELDRHPVPHTKGSEEHQLTEREQDVVKLLALGHSHKEIGRILNISIHTVISHRKNITLKLGIKSVSGLAVYAIISGYIDTDKIDPESLI